MQFIVTEIVQIPFSMQEMEIYYMQIKVKVGILEVNVRKCKIVQGHFRVFAVILLATCCGFGVEL